VRVKEEQEEGFASSHQNQNALSLMIFKLMMMKIIMRNSEHSFITNIRWLINEKYFEKNNNNSLVESVYSIIKNRKRKVTTKYLENEIGSKYKVRYSVTRLIKEGKIKRIRALGRERIEYFYKDIK
jgi:hypothetical protein